MTSKIWLRKLLLAYLLPGYDASVFLFAAFIYIKIFNVLIPGIMSLLFIRYYAKCFTLIISSNPLRNL